MTSRTVTLWDPPITTEVFEAGSGDPIVFLHGAGGTNLGDPLIQALAATRTVIAPRHPGFADPDELDEIRDIHDLAIYHDELFDALGLDTAAVIGHSFGGMVAAELAAHYPSRVSKLVLAAPVGLWDDRYPVADFFSAFPMKLNDLLWADPSGEAAARTMAALAEGADDRTEEVDALTAMLLNVLPGLITAGKFMWPIPDRGLSRRLRRITADTLIVWGEQDRLAPPAYADDFVAKIPNATAEFLSDAGHMAPWERLDDFVKLATDFV